MDRIRFLLWRLEFAGDAGAIDEIAGCMEAEGISVHALTVLIETSSIDKKKICLSLADALLGRGAPADSLVLVRKCVQLFSEDEECVLLYQEFLRLASSPA